MDGLFPYSPVRNETFTDLGRSTLIDRKPVIGGLDVAGPPSDIRRALRAQCPCLPGVYGMIDRDGDLIYVGMSRRLRGRLLTYFTKGPPEAKEQRVAAHTHRLIWEVADHEFAAQLRELELIRQWYPRFNSVGRPGRREVGYIYLTPTAAPNFRFGRRPPRNCRACWGPLPLTRQTRTAVTRINHLFLLRDCPDRAPIHFREQRTILAPAAHPACIRGQVGNCLAPCAGDRSRHDYFGAIAAARSFLDGCDKSILDRHEAAMHEAARQQDYELAAQQRDLWQSLSALWNQLDTLRVARRDLWGVDAFDGCSGRVWWAVIVSGSVVRVVPRPSSRRTARSCLQLIESTFTQPHVAAAEDFDQIRLVVSWYRQHGMRRAMMTPAAACEICSRLLEPSRQRPAVTVTQSSN